MFLKKEISSYIVITFFFGLLLELKSIKFRIQNISIWNDLHIFFLLIFSGTVSLLVITGIFNGCCSTFISIFSIVFTMHVHITLPCFFTTIKILVSFTVALKFFCKTFVKPHIFLGHQANLSCLCYKRPFYAVRVFLQCFVLSPLEILVLNAQRKKYNTHPRWNPFYHDHSILFDSSFHGLLFIVQSLFSFLSVFN